MQNSSTTFEVLRMSTPGTCGRHSLAWFLGALKELEKSFKRIDFRDPGFRGRYKEYEELPCQLVNGVIVVYRHRLLHDHCLVSIVGVSRTAIEFIWTFYRLEQRSRTSWWLKPEVVLAGRINEFTVGSTPKERHQLQCAQRSVLRYECTKQNISGQRQVSSF